MNKFIVGEFWKQHRTCKPKLSNTLKLFSLNGNRHQGKHTFKTNSKLKSSSVVKLNKNKQGKEWTTLKKQIFSSLPFLMWKKVASPLVELIIPSLIHKRTLLEISNFRTNKALHHKIEPGYNLNVKCCEQPKPFDIGEKIKINYIETFPKKKKCITSPSLNIYTTSKKKNYLFNSCSLIKKVIGSKLVKFIPKINQEQKLDNLNDFRQFKDSGNLDLGYFGNDTVITHCEDLSMNRDIPEQTGPFPSVWTESPSNNKEVERTDVRTIKTSSKRITNQSQIKHLQKRNILRKKLGINIKNLVKQNNNLLTSPQANKISEASKYSGKSQATSRNINKTVKKNRTNNNERLKIQEKAANETHIINSFGTNYKKKKRHVNKLLSKKKTNFYSNRRDGSIKGNESREKLTTGNVKNELKRDNLNLEQKGTFFMLSGLNRGKVKKDFATEVNQEKNFEVEFVGKLKENSSLLKTENIVFNENSDTDKLKKAKDRVENQVVDSKLATKTMPKRHLVPFTHQFNNLTASNFAKQPINQNNVELPKTKIDGAHSNLHTSFDTPRISKDTSGITECAGNHSKYFSEEKDCLQNIRNMLKALQRSSIEAETNQGKSYNDTKVIKTKQEPILQINKKDSGTGIQNIKTEKLSRNLKKNLIDTMKLKEDVIKSNFVVFDTSGEGGNLIIKEQNISIGKGIINNLIKFEHVLQEEEARLKSFNQTKEKNPKNRSEPHNDSYNASVLKPWRRQKESLESDKKQLKNIPTVTWSKGNINNLTVPSDKTFSKQISTKKTYKVTSINNFHELSTDKKTLEEIKECNTRVKTDSVNDKTDSTKEEKDVKKPSKPFDNVVVFQNKPNLKYVGKANNPVNKECVLVNDSKDQTSKYDYNNIEKLNPVTISNKGSLNVSKTSIDKDNSEINTKQEKDFKPNLNNQLSKLKTDNRKLPLKQTELVEVRGNHQDQSKLPITGKHVLEFKNNSSVIMNNLKQSNERPLQKVNIKTGNKNHSHSITTAMKTNEPTESLNKSNKLKVEAKVKAKRCHEHGNRIKKTVSLLSNPSNKMSSQNALYKKTVSVEAVRKNPNIDSTQHGVVNLQNKSNLPTNNDNKLLIYEQQGDNLTTSSKHKLSHKSKKNNNRPAKRAQSENITHSNQIHKIADSEKNSTEKKNPKQSIEISKQSIREIKPVKSTSLYDLKQVQTQDTKKTKTLTDKKLDAKTPNNYVKYGAEDPKSHLLGEFMTTKKDTIVNVSKDHKNKLSSGNSFNGHVKGSSAQINLVENTSVSHVDSTNLISENSPSIVNSSLIASEHKKPHTEKSLVFNEVKNKTVAPHNNVIKTNIANSELEVKMLNKSSKPTNSIQIKSLKTISSDSNNIQNNNIKYERDNCENKNHIDLQNENGGANIYRKSLTSQNGTYEENILKSGNSSKNEVKDRSKSLLSEKKKLKSKLTHLLHSLPITGQQTKSIKSQQRIKNQETTKEKKNSKINLKTVKYNDSKTESLTKNKDTMPNLKPSKDNLAIKTEVSMSTRQRSENPVKELTKNSSGLNNIVEDIKGAVENTSRNDIIKAKKTLSNSMITQQNKSDKSRIKEKIVTNNTEKVKLGKVVSRQDEIQTKTRHYAKIAQPLKNTETILNKKIGTKAKI